MVPAVSLGARAAAEAGRFAAHRDRIYRTKLASLVVALVVASFESSSNMLKCHAGLKE